MAQIEIDDDLFRQLEILFTALQAEVPALSITNFANVALGAALEELLESSTVRVLCAHLAAERGEDWEAMSERVNRLIHGSVVQIGAQRESRENTLLAAEIKPNGGDNHDGSS